MTYTDAANFTASSNEVLRDCDSLLLDIFNWAILLKMHPSPNTPSFRIHQIAGCEEDSPSYEYPLPITDLPSDQFQRLGKWMQFIAKGDTEAASRSLEMRWREFCHPPHLALIEYYQRFLPISVVIHDQQAWLLCVRPDTHFSGATTFLVPEPVNAESVRTRLKSHGFHDDVLSTFISAFGGIREDFFPVDGHFVEGTGEWRLTGKDDETWEAEFQKGVQGYADWIGALHLYCARNGDTLLAHPTGKVGWWIGNSWKIVEYASSISEFCDRYIDFRVNAWKRTEGRGKLLAWPYDYYSSNDFRSH